MDYLDITSVEQAFIIKELKEKMDLTWKEIANAVNVDRSMIYFYANGKSRIPKNKYHLLCMMARVDPLELPILRISNKEKMIRVPEGGGDLEEFLAAFALFGHLNPLTYEVAITVPYFEMTRIKALFKTLFDIEPTTIRCEDSVRVKTYSKALYVYLQGISTRTNDEKRIVMPA